MLGRLRMSVEDAINSYAELSKAIFGKQKSTLKRSKFSAKNFKQVIKSVVKSQLGNEDAKCGRKRTHPARGKLIHKLSSKID